MFWGGKGLGTGPRCSEIFRAVIQLPLVLYLYVHDLRDPLLQEGPHPRQHQATLVPEAAGQAQHNSRPVQLHQLHSAGDAHALVEQLQELRARFLRGCNLGPFLNEE